MTGRDEVAVEAKPLRRRKGDDTNARPAEGKLYTRVIRHEVVAEIRESDTSDIPPLKAALIATADYIGENSHTAHGIALEFELHGATFRVSMDPSHA